MPQNVPKGTGLQGFGKRVLGKAEALPGRTMKKPLYLLTAIALLSAYNYIADAAIPDIITDPNTRDAMEYIDAKADPAIQAVNGFADADVTTSFAGTIDIGLEIITCNCGGGNECTSSCSTGKRVLGGGCVSASANAIYSSYPTSNSAWRCYSSAINCSGYAICARVK